MTWTWTPAIVHMGGTKMENYTSLLASFAATHERASFLPSPGEAAHHDEHFHIPRAAAQGAAHCLSRVRAHIEARGTLCSRDSLQIGDEPGYDGMLELFPQSYHEPYFASYLKEDFGAIGTASGLTHIRDVNAFVSKVMVFDKP